VRPRELFFTSPEFLISAAIALAVFGLIYAALRLSLARRDRRRGRFSRSRIRLLGEAAMELGADAVDDPDVAGVPHLKSRPPDPPYGLALAPTGEDGEEYFPIFEAPVTGAVFLEVWPSGSPFAPLRVSMGGDGVSLGDPAFDSSYIVRTDDPHFARTLLGPEARTLIETGRKIGTGGRLRLNVDRLRLRIRKEEALSLPRDLVAFTRVGLGLLEQIREAVENQAAVQFFDAAPPADAKSACPVCGAGLAAGRVTCRRCRTPHHRECWDYAGGCSMFACGETRFSL
jgi:hypothetical protein